MNAQQVLTVDRQALEQEGKADAKRARTSSTPPLRPGDHLSRAEFERRYSAHPEIKTAELIEGVVYMPSPVRFEQHGRLNSDIITWLGTYRSETPGIQGGDNTTVLLDYENEVQPDAFLRLRAEYGGNSYITENDYIAGPPELIVEVAASSAAYDLHTKKQVYARDGVQEYIAVQVYEQRVDWFALREGVYETLTPEEATGTTADADATRAGCLKSEGFPGLWLCPAALWEGDIAGLLACLREGLASPEHEAFVAQLRVKAESGKQ